MKLRWKAITCDAQRLLTKSQMWGKLWHATVQAGGWVGVRSGREKHLPGKTPQTAPPGQDLNVFNAATKSILEPWRSPGRGMGGLRRIYSICFPPPVVDRATLNVVALWRRERVGRANTADGADWWTLKCLVFVPCSFSKVSCDHHTMGSPITHTKLAHLCRQCGKRLN